MRNAFMMLFMLRLMAEQGGDGGAAGGGAGGQDGQAKGGDAGAGASDKGGGGDAAAAAAAKNGDGAGKGADDPLTVAWPDRWREAYALGGDGKVDPKMLKRFERYGSPKAVAEALIAAQNRISSGELKSTAPFPEGGSAEDQAAWRTSQGIPAEAKGEKGYKLELAQGLVMGEEDKPVIDRFLESAHKSHMPASQVNAAVNWYFQDQAKQAAEQDQRDEAYRVSSDDKLHAEWGNDYRANINVISAMLDTAPAGIKELFLGGRLSDGTPLGSNPDMLRWMVGLARQINPVSTLVPGAGTNIGQAIDDEIKKIEGWMAAPKGSKDYNKYYKDESIQARYRELLDGRERAKKAA